MNAPFPAFFDWLLRSSWQAAVLTVLVLLAQLALGKRLDGRWRHLLWCLVVARLLLPWSPPSPASLYNYLHFAHQPASPPAAILPAAPVAARSPTPLLSPAPNSPPPAPVTIAPRPASTLSSPLIAPPHRILPRWSVLLAAAWAAGVGILLARLIVQNYRFRRRLRSATEPADQELVRLFEDCRAAMGVSSGLRLIQTRRVATPALYGLFRLRLLLPPDLAARFSPTELRHIFLHELSHVRRHDMAMQWLITVLRIVHWFNPVLWFGFRRMVADRELACDELALSAVAEGESPAYGRTIVKLLEYYAGASPQPGLVGILEDKDQIFRRVSMIAAFKRHSRWSIIGAASAAVLGLATLTGAQTQAVSRTNAPSSLPSRETTTATNAVDLRVAAIVRDWENLPNVFQDVDSYSGQIRELVRLGKPAVPALCAALDHTDHDASQRLLGFTLRAIGDPHAVPALIRAIPKTLRPPGSDCGMSVSDPALLAFMRANDLDVGQPFRAGTGFAMGRPVREIGGALAKLTGTHVDEDAIYSLFLEGGETQRAAARNAYYQVARRWADWWKTNHERLITDTAEDDLQLPPPPRTTTPSRFLVGANIKVSEGAGGMILASVENGQNCGLAMGVTRFFNLPAQLISTNGSPSLENISVWAAKAGVDLLGAQYREPQSGKNYYTLRGVGLQAWEIPNDRWSTIATNLQHGDLPALDSPAGDLLIHYDLASASYSPERKATFLFITREGLQGILRVTGQVTRKYTQSDLGIPYSPPDESDPDQTSDAGPFLGVKFDYKFFYEETAQMKAESKAREASAAATTEAHQQNKITALLDEYPHVEGTVFSPAGQPVANAAILIGINGEPAVLYHRRFSNESEATVMATRADGRFTIPLMPHATAYVAHDEGFSQLNLDGVESPLAIHLAPWGRIEGTVTLEGKLAPHQTMALLDAAPNYAVAGVHLSFSAQTESDDQGRFVFEGIPPGEVKVCRMVSNYFSDEQVVDVIAGQTTVCRHGFNGRIVRGHLRTSDASAVKNWKQGLTLTFMSKSFYPDPPANEEANAWRLHYWQTAEGKAAFRASHHFTPLIEPNGDFHIDDVPPGTYRMEVFLHDGPQMVPGVFGGKMLGQLKQDVVIPEHSDGPADSPLDLGNFVLPILRSTASALPRTGTDL
jgi:beta-lactamase regulating signal transducer with metallopeptidase domain